MDKAFLDFIQFEYGGANLDSHTSLLEFFDFLETRGFLFLVCVDEIKIALLLKQPYEISVLLQYYSEIRPAADEEI